MGISFWVFAFLTAIIFAKVRQLRDLTRATSQQKNKPSCHYEGHAYRGPTEMEIHKRDIKLEMERSRIQRIRQHNRELLRENERLRRKRMMFCGNRLLPLLLGAFSIFLSGLFMGALLKGASTDSTATASRSFSRATYPNEREPPEGWASRTPVMCLEIEPMLHTYSGRSLEVENERHRYHLWLPLRAHANVWYWPYFQLDCATDSCWMPAHSTGGEDRLWPYDYRIEQTSPSVQLY